MIKRAIVVGTRKSPAWLTDAPKPYPVDVDVWTNWGIRMNALYMPKPSRSAAAFVVQTPLNRIILMSTSGCRERLSALTQAAADTADATTRPMVFPDPQPQADPSLTATSRATSQAERSRPPSQWMLPGARILTRE